MGTFFPPQPPPPEAAHAVLSCRQENPGLTPTASPQPTSDPCRWGHRAQEVRAERGFSQPRRASSTQRARGRHRQKPEAPRESSGTGRFCRSRAWPAHCFGSCKRCGKHCGL